MVSGIPPTGGSGNLSEPPPTGAPGSQSGKAFQPGGGWGAFEKWMGKKNFEQFQKNLCQGIVHQIGKDKDKEHKAAQQLQRAEKGEDMYADS